MNLKLMSIYKDHNPPLMRNLDVNDIPGARAPVKISRNVREDCDGIHLGKVKDNYGKEKNFFRPNSHITDQQESLMKYNPDIDSNKSIFKSESSQKALQTNKNTAKEMLSRPTLSGIMEAPEIYKMPQRSDMGISNFRGEAKYKKYMRNRQNSKELFDGYVRDENLNSYEPKRSNNNIIPEHVTESFNYGSGYTAGNNLNSHQKYFTSKLQHSTSNKSLSKLEEPINKTRFVENMRQFYNMQPNASDLNFLNKLDISKDYHETILNPKTQFRKKPLYQSKKNRNKHGMSQPVKYLSQSEMNQNKEDIIEQHNRLTHEMLSNLHKKSNLKEFEKHASKNPFVWPRMKFNQLGGPQQPFIQTKAPHLVETQIPKTSDPNILHTGRKFISKDHASSLKLNPEKKLNDIKFHSPEKWESLISKKKGHIKNLSIDNSNFGAGIQGASNNSNCRQNNESSHQGFSYNPKTNSLMQDNHRAQLSDRNNNNKINDTVFVANTDLRTHNYDITYKRNRGYEPKFLYGPGTRTFEGVSNNQIKIVVLKINN